MNYGYDFYFKDGSDLLIFPITPSEMSIKVGSNNKVVTLIDEGDINLLKSPSLVEIEFTARFPMRKYPYSREFDDFMTYHDKFKELKEKKKFFRFIVKRTTPNGVGTWDTNMLMALESYYIKENAEDGDDVLVEFKLKQYKEYGTKVIKLDSTTTVSTNTAVTTSTSTTTRPNENTNSTTTTYVVKEGDCLWAIAKAYYGSGAKWDVIYEANKSAIEEDAKKHGKASSSNGQWIWEGLTLILPNAS